MYNSWRSVWKFVENTIFVSLYNLIPFQAKSEIGVDFLIEKQFITSVGLRKLTFEDFLFKEQFHVLSPDWSACQSFQFRDVSKVHEEFRLSVIQSTELSMFNQDQSWQVLNKLVFYKINCIIFHNSFPSPPITPHQAVAAASSVRFQFHRFAYLT